MKGFLKGNSIYVLMFFSAVMITALSIVFKSPPLKIFPLYVSLIVMLLNSHINRFGPLIGSVNSIIYAIVYFQMKVYGTALFSLLFSCPLQFITFIRWSGRAYKHSTVLRTLSRKKRIVVATSFIGIWVLFYCVLRAVGSSHILIDNTSTMLGILATVMQMLSYAEYTYLAIPNLILAAVLQISLITSGEYEQTTYLVSNAFSAFCSIRAITTAKRLLKERNYTANIRP